MTTATQTPPAARPEALAVSVEEAASMVGLGRTSFYALLRSGEIPSIRVGARRLIAVSDLRDWLARRAAEAVGA